MSDQQKPLEDDEEEIVEVFDDEETAQPSQGQSEVQQAMLASGTLLH